MGIFGFLVVFGIFVYSMKEKYDIWQREKEFARKWSHKEKGKQKGFERRQSQRTTNDNKKRYEMTKNSDYCEGDGYAHNHIIEEDEPSKSTKKKKGKFNKKQTKYEKANVVL